MDLASCQNSEAQGFEVAGKFVLSCLNPIRRQLLRAEFIT